jgi:hypothetical protein
MVALEVAQRDDLAAQLVAFSTGYWATFRAADGDDLALEVQAGWQHLRREIGCSIPGSLGADQAAAVFRALRSARGMLVADLLVVTEEVADLPAADPDVAAGTSVSAPTWRNSSRMKAGRIA